MQLRTRKKPKVDPDFIFTAEDVSESEEEDIYEPEEDDIYEPETKKPRSRKTSPGSTITFQSLPDELLVHIISMITDPKTLISFMFTCKGMRRVMDPTTVTGQKIWKNLRSNLEWPDPLTFGMSDYKFIRCYYGRGCNNCTRRPLTRKPYWEFDGLRLCGKCYHEITERDYILAKQNISPDLYIHLPSIEVGGYSRSSGYWTYRLYLKSHILTSPPSQEQINEMKQRRQRLYTFIRDFESREKRMMQERKKEKELEKDLRLNSKGKR